MLSNSFISANVSRFAFLVCIRKALHSLTHCSVYFQCLQCFLLLLHSTFYMTIFYSGIFLQINFRIFALIIFFYVLIINKLLKIPKMHSSKCISYAFFTNYNHFEWLIFIGEKRENKHDVLWTLSIILSSFQHFVLSSLFNIWFLALRKPKPNISSAHLERNFIG
jgi:hypothetical protein